MESGEAWEDGAYCGINRDWRARLGFPGHSRVLGQKETGGHGVRIQLELRLARLSFVLARSGTLDGFLLLQLSWYNNVARKIAVETKFQSRRSI